MNEIITTSEYPIEIETFWINKNDIEQIKIEKSIEEENRIIIWLIIWKIRKKFIELHYLSETTILWLNIENKEIQNIINILSLALDIPSQKFNNFEELWIFIFEKYDFKDIKNDFLCNEIHMSEFLKWCQIFLNHNFDNTPKKTDQIINSVQEL